MADTESNSEFKDLTPAQAVSEERAEQNPAPPASGSSFFGERSSQLDDWLAVERDGRIIVFSGKVELGTGTRTALAQIVAEELDVRLDRVQMVMGDTARTPDEGYTAGSMTIQMSGTVLRDAAAEARAALLEAASDRLDANVDELTVTDGIVLVRERPERAVSYAELMGGTKFNRTISNQAPVKSPDTYRIVGAAAPRVDLPAKLTGQPSFVQDVRLEGMLHARVVRPPSAGAQLVALDTSALDASGIAHSSPSLQVVHRNNFVAVIAEREEDVVRAAAALRVKWRETAALPPMSELYETLVAQPTNDDVLVEDGDLEQGLAEAVHRVSATYYQPYHAHASIGPSCAVAHVTAEGTTVWCSTQGPHPLRGALAQLLQLPPEKVRLIHVEGAGCYGQNGSDDVAADAVILSREVGKPVRVQWSREDEFIWEPKSAAMVIQVSGGVDAEGRITGWDYQVWSPTHTSRPRFAPQLLTFQLLTGQAPPPTRFFLGAERNAPTNYTLPNQRVTVHWLAESPLRVSSFRSLGGAGNTFANESFMDELAAAAGADPLEFRLRHLDDPRAREVLHAAANAARWDARPSQRNSTEELAQGRGLAFAQYENDEALVACVAFVTVERASGKVRVQRIVVAHDCGLVVNPDGVKNQIEGNVIQSLSRALLEEVQFDRTRITSVDWQSYPILTFSEIPEIEIVLLNRPDMAPVGAGEAATVTTAAAVANAIFEATGARIRQVPFTPERVRAALALH